METATVSIVTEVLVNFLIGGFALVSISWGLIGIQTFFNDRKREKREEEYHIKQMEELDKIKNM